MEAPVSAERPGELQSRVTSSGRRAARQQSPAVGAGLVGRAPLPAIDRLFARSRNTSNTSSGSGSGSSGSGGSSRELGSFDAHKNAVTSGMPLANQRQSCARSARNGRLPVMRESADEITDAPSPVRPRPPLDATRAALHCKKLFPAAPLRLSCCRPIEVCVRVYVEVCVVHYRSRPSRLPIYLQPPRPPHDADCLPWQLPRPPTHSGNARTIGRLPLRLAPRVSNERAASQIHGEPGLS